MRLTTLIPNVVGKILIRVLRALGRSATTFPGRIALKCNPSLIGDLLAVEQLPTAVVTGTNGKTTTVAQLCDILAESGKTTVSNASGANMSAGVATSLIENSDCAGRLDAAAVVLEVDEAALKPLLPPIQPEVVVVTNFFADQLDRYGQLQDTVSTVKESLRSISSCVTACLNADDPIVVGLQEGISFSGSPIFYGVTKRLADSRDKVPRGHQQVQHCARCGDILQYQRQNYAHLGDYRCPGCSFARPPLDVEVEVVSCRADHSRIEVSLSPRVSGYGDGKSFSAVLTLPGVYNVYNAAAAIAAGCAMGSSASGIQAGVDGFQGVFGRWESFFFPTGRARMALVKNAAGFNQVLQSIAETPGSKTLVLVLNDREADGRDISWIWDIQLEDSAVVDCDDVDFAVAGERADDLALRLKYAGLPDSRLQVIRSIKETATCAQRLAGEVDELYLLPNYTAMWELRREMLRRDVKSDK